LDIGLFFYTVSQISTVASLKNVNYVDSGVLLKAIWVPGQGCVIIETDSKILAATFIYSMVFDFIVLFLTAFKLLYPPNGRSKLVELIFNDGLIYFVIALVIGVPSILETPINHSYPLVSSPT